MPHPPRFLRSLARIGLAAMLGLGVCASGGGDAAVALASGAAERSKIASGDGVSDLAAAQAVLAVAPSDPLLEPSQSRFEFAVRVENPSDTAIPAGKVVLELQSQRLESTEQLDEPFPDLGARVADAQMGSVPADDGQSTTVTVRNEDFPLTASDQPGVYLLRAVFTPEEESATPISGTVPFVWRGAGARQSSTQAGSEPNASDGSEPAVTPPSVQLGVIIPLVLPTSVHATPTVAELDEAVPRFESLLDVATKARATVAIDPRIIAGIRAYGDNASAPSRELLKRLESMASPSFLLQFADADPAAQSAIGLTELLRPTNLDYLTRQGSFPEVEDQPDEQADDVSGSEPDGTADAPVEERDSETAPGGASGSVAEEGDDGTQAQPATAHIPSLDELLSWPQQTRPIAWPAEGQVDSETISLLEASGIDDFVLSAQNTTHEGGPRATLGSGHALITDTALGSSVRTALAAGEETARRAALSAASARVALTAQAPNSGLLLAVHRGALADAEDPAALVEQLISPGWVESTPVQALAEGAASLRSASTLEERRELLRSAANREADVNEVNVMLQHPQDLKGYQRARLLNLFATRHADADADFARVAKQYTKYDEQLRSGVQLVSAEHTQLVGTSTQVPLQLRNYLPFDAVVSARVLPASAALRVGEREFDEIVVAADGNARVLVPVRSRVSSGESGLAVEVTDRTGEYVSDAQTLPLTIRSGIEKIGLWTLGLLAALLLVFGTVRSVRRRRRSGAARGARENAGDGEGGNHGGNENP